MGNWRRFLYLVLTRCFCVGERLPAILHPEYLRYKDPMVCDFLWLLLGLVNDYPVYCEVKASKYVSFYASEDGEEAH